VDPAILVEAPMLAMVASRRICSKDSEERVRRLPHRPRNSSISAMSLSISGEISGISAAIDESRLPISNIQFNPFTEIDFSP
jgi:hypothetical protein